jgi:MFS family permease
MGLNRNAWWISFSAFFADLGYQAVIAGLPLFLVLTLQAPDWVFGLTTALGYGGGALIAYLGGRLGDRFGHKVIAILGNSLIPLLSFTGITTSVVAAASLFTVGWWARNFRTPSRRVMLTEAVAREQESRAFGLLHALDVGGGMLAAISAFFLVLYNVPFRTIFLITLLPLVASTVCLAVVHLGSRHEDVSTQAGEERPAGSANPSRLYWGIIAATALYGFSSYSIGFPILTVAQSTRREASGVLAYALFLGISALTGVLMGWRSNASIPVLALLGYLLAGLGSAGLALAYHFGGGAAALYGAVAVLGVALGVIETLEPTWISRITTTARRGRGMGSLTASRSIGLFVGNVSMGLLYQLSPTYSYIYATVVAVAAAIILLAANRARQEG